MRAPDYITKALRSLDPRLFVEFNNITSRWEFRMKLTPSELAIEGLDPLEEIDVGCVNGMHFVELVPVTAVVKVWEHNGEYLPLTDRCIYYMQSIDTHKWDNITKWIDHLDNIGQEELERVRYRKKLDRIYEFRSMWEVDALGRRSFSS